MSEQARGQSDLYVWGAAVAICLAAAIYLLAHRPWHESTILSFLMVGIAGLNAAGGMYRAWQKQRHAK